MPSPRRFPPPWSVELTRFDLDQTTSFRQHVIERFRARRIAANIARLPELLMPLAVIEL
jgi:hypothetical protein